VKSEKAAFARGTAVYVIPKSNATIKGSYAWKDMVRDLISYSFLFLGEYFRREHSESGFSADKRVMAGRFGRGEMAEYTQQRCAKAFGTISSG
jgi:transposase